MQAPGPTHVSVLPGMHTIAIGPPPPPPDPLLPHAGPTTPAATLRPSTNPRGPTPEGRRWFRLVNICLLEVTRAPPDARRVRMIDALGSAPICALTRRGTSSGPGDLLYRNRAPSGNPNHLTA